METMIARHTKWREWLSLVTASLLLSIGIATIAGWLLHWPFWRQIATGFAPTIGTGLLLALAGAGLLAWRRATLLSIRMGRALGVCMAAIGAAFLLEYLTGLNLHVDLPRLHAWAADPNPWPGRTSPNTALSAIAAGIALWLSDRSYFAKRLRRTLAAALLTTTVLSALTVLGKPTTADVFSLTIAIQFGSSAWYRLPVMNPLLAALFGLVAINLLWLDELLRAAKRLAASPSSYGKSDFFFGVAFSVLLTVAIASNGSLKDLHARINLSDRGHQTRLAFEELIINYDRAQAIWGRTIGLAEPEASALQELEAAANQANTRVTQLMTLISDRAEDAAQLDATSRLLFDDFAFMHESIRRKLAGDLRDDSSILVALRTPRLHIEQVLERIVAIRDAASAELDQRRQASLSGMRAATTVLTFGSAGGFAVLIVAFIVLLKAQEQRALLEDGLRQANEDLEKRVEERTRAVLTANRQLEAVNATLEQRVEERTAALAERTADLESFSYSVSHDLRAPLRAIDGYASMLEDEHVAGLKSDDKQLLLKMRGQVKRMSELIDNLLRLSQFGRQALNEKQVDMQRMVREIWEEVLHDRLAQGAAHEPVLNLKELPDIQADPNLLRQVWLNLIDNAIKYSSRVPQPFVIIEAIQNDKDTVFSIRDNGVGFDMSQTDKLFGVFQRLHDQSTFSGTGVGLAIVSKIVRRHGGQVWAEGMPDQGATFHFSIPRIREFSAVG